MNPLMFDIGSILHRLITQWDNWKNRLNPTRNVLKWEDGMKKFGILIT